MEPTRYFHPKNEDSVGDVEVDFELMQIFSRMRDRESGSPEFVINSRIKPRLSATYEHYRCQAYFERLTRWLRKHGVKAGRPLHELRKEFGSLLNETYESMLRAGL